VSMRMLLPPKCEQQGRHMTQDGFGAMDLGVTRRTKRDHEVQQRFARHPVMHRDRALIPSRGAADPAGMAVSLEHGLPQTTEVGLILPLERIAGRAMAIGHDLRPAARTIEGALEFTFHGVLFKADIQREPFSHPFFSGLRRSIAALFCSALACFPL
jgi:hypothetical protein